MPTIVWFHVGMLVAILALPRAWAEPPLPMLPSTSVLPVEASQAELAADLDELCPFLSHPVDLLDRFLPKPDPEPLDWEAAARRLDGTSLPDDPWRIVEAHSREVLGRSMTIKRESEYVRMSHEVGVDRFTEWAGEVSYNSWVTDSSVKVSMPFLESLQVFTNVWANSETDDTGAARITTRTGVSLRVEPLPRSEVIVRGGPSVSYGDPVRAVQVAANSESQVFVEIEARYALVGPLKLEYFGTATPALDETERDRLNQDVRLALSLGPRGKVHLGARYRWEDPVGQVPLSMADRMQLYLGLSLRR